MLVMPLPGAVGTEDVEKMRAFLETGADPDHPSAARTTYFQATLLKGDYFNLSVFYADCPIALEALYQPGPV